MKQAITASVFLIAILSGCATRSSDIRPTYVSPVAYQSYDCDQLNAEAQRIQVRVSQLGGRLDEAATHDKELAASAIILWPTLFALGGTKQQEADYALLRGQYDAVQQESIAKKCNMTTQSTTPTQSATNTNSDVKKP
jgi:hypothetical protein